MTSLIIHEIATMDHNSVFIKANFKLSNSIFNLKY